MVLAWHWDGFFIGFICCVFSFPFSVFTFPFLFVSAFSVARSERLIQRQRSLLCYSASSALSAGGLLRSVMCFLHADYAESAEFFIVLGVLRWRWRGSQTSLRRESAEGVC